MGSAVGAAAGDPEEDARRRPRLHSAVRRAQHCVAIGWQLALARAWGGGVHGVAWMERPQANKNVAAAARFHRRTRCRFGEVSERLQEDEPVEAERVEWAGKPEGRVISILVPARPPRPPGAGRPSRRSRSASHESASLPCGGAGGGDRLRARRAPNCRRCRGRSSSQGRTLSPSATCDSPGAP